MIMIMIGIIIVIIIKPARDGAHDVRWHDGHDEGGEGAGALAARALRREEPDQNRGGDAEPRRHQAADLEEEIAGGA